MWLIVVYSVVIRYDTFSETRELLMLASQSLLVTYGCWVLTGWVYIQFKRQHNNNQHSSTRMNKGTKGQGKKRTSKSTHLTLTEIVSNAEGFELFCNHLVSEYSIENMLFVLEIEIIKDEMIEYKLSTR